ncbi:enhancer of mRNA-decapping protein 4 isoform X2 [Sitophilus oryzae]|uniref:Enhancer of mRNA-decapping protein 4 isoform X2 n=1 Tax=Sitophilus oryzae TaxID=7048 RepID=A0A6J2YNU9_SITOR|nr:enhancer of mRNA-decapping protein 4 isoform X2 [Sitophilus oryzae]
MANATTQNIIQNATQDIKFLDNDVSEYGTEILGKVVNVQCGHGNHCLGSSKVQLCDRVNYNWEFKYYHGHLIAAHFSRNIIAFTMKNKEGSMVRVADQYNPEKKTLIKNLKGDVKDLAFAYSSLVIILGCIDSEGNILIYSIQETLESIACVLLCHIFHQESPGSDNYRLIWCPFVPSYEEDEESDIGDEPDKMFVVLNGKRAEIYNVGVLSKKYGSEFSIDPDETYEGYIEINHTSDINNASFSLDGTAVAIACQDGFVKFFQLYMLDQPKQKCLHEWKPHNGKPLSSILFVDNVLEFSPECWKFTITTAENNSEIKLWSCESWQCLQTINFYPNVQSKVPELFLNIAIDYRGQFVVVSDINNKGIYVMRLKKNEAGNQIGITQLYHLLLPAPFLSFHILDADIRRVPYSYDNSDAEESYEEDMICLDDLNDVAAEMLNLKMLIIQPKRFQECFIKFQVDDLLTKSDTEKGLTQLADLKVEENNEEEEEVIQEIPQLNDLQNSVNLLIQQTQLENSNPKLTLMTPDDFTTSGKNSKSSSIRNSMTNENISEEPDNKLNENNVKDFEKPQKENFASAGSSPSREVQEILSLTNSSTGYPTQEYFNNLANLEVDGEQEQPQKDYSAETDNGIIYQDSLSWPKIPLVKQNDAIKQVTGTNELNHQDLETVYMRINSLELMLTEQKVLLQQLHQDIKATNQKIGGATTSVDRTEFVHELDAAMSKQHLQIAQLLENLVQLQKAKDREMQENILSAVNQMLTKSISDKLQHTLQHEIKHSVLPTVHQLVESYRHQIDTQYNNKFTNIDTMVRENFAKVISSKSLTESISVSVVSLIAPTLDKCYRDIIAQSLLPSWERVCGQMFQQINETFTKGTKEYTASVETYMERQRKVQEKGKDLITQMQSVSDNMKGNADKLSEIVSSEIQKQFGLVFKNVQDKLTNTLKETVTLEIKQGFKSQAAALEEGVINAVRSRAVTPAPHADSHLLTMTHIQQALTKRNYDEAFQLALSAENLNYVIFVCERVDVNQVFNERCLLSQSVLLALIQQLSMEIHKNTETKLCFIRAAFLALSPDFAQTKHFVPNVLKDLLKQLTAFMQTNPPLKQMTETRLLKMAVENMLSK